MLEAVSAAEITDLLRAAREGDARASHRIFDLAYADLKRIAHARLRGSDARCELDTTSVVHEAFLRLRDVSAEDRNRFYAYAARAMRSVIVDHVRERNAQKRGDGLKHLTLTTGVQGDSFDDEQLLALNEALDVLERIAPDYRELVELRYFAGLSVEELADLRGTSKRTLLREWTKARAFLRQLIVEGRADPP